MPSKIVIPNKQLKNIWITSFFVYLFGNTSFFCLFVWLIPITCITCTNKDKNSSSLKGSFAKWDLKWRFCDETWRDKEHINMEILKIWIPQEGTHRLYLFIFYLKLTIIKTDTIVCTTKNSYATKDMLIYVNCLTINVLLTKNDDTYVYTHTYIYIIYI